MKKKLKEAKDWFGCQHENITMKKHKENAHPCVHCLECSATWSGPRGFFYLYSRAKGKSIKFQKS